MQVTNINNTNKVEILIEYSLNNLQQEILNK